MRRCDRSNIDLPGGYGSPSAPPLPSEVGSRALCCRKDSSMNRAWTDSESVGKLRPSDDDALRAQLRLLQISTGLPVLFGGAVHGHDMILSGFVGTRSNILRNLVISSECGVGGRAIAEQRPVSIADYFASDRITTTTTGRSRGKASNRCSPRPSWCAVVPRHDVRRAAGQHADRRHGRRTGDGGGTGAGPRDRDPGRGGSSRRTPRERPCAVAGSGGGLGVGVGGHHRELSGCGRSRPRQRTRRWKRSCAPSGRNCAR